MGPGWPVPAVKLLSRRGRRGADSLRRPPPPLRERLRRPAAPRSRDRRCLEALRLRLSRSRSLSRSLDRRSFRERLLLRSRDLLRARRRLPERRSAPRSPRSPPRSPADVSRAASRPPLSFGSRPSRSRGSLWSFASASLGLVSRSRSRASRASRSPRPSRSRSRPPPSRLSRSRSRSRSRSLRSFSPRWRSRLGARGGSPPIMSWFRRAAASSVKDCVLPAPAALSRERDLLRSRCRGARLSSLPAGTAGGGCGPAEPPPPGGCSAKAEEGPLLLPRATWTGWP